MNTMQQEFDAVVAHLYAQGRPAKTEVPTHSKLASCRYRAGTLSCAVGCRIPDAVYTEAMDMSDGGGGTGLCALLERFGDVLPVEIKTYHEMFDRLQDVHDQTLCNGDGTFLLNVLAQSLQEVADEFGLTFTAPEAK